MPWFAGVERETINWHPTIDETKCVRCGICMNCGRKVYEWRDGRPQVVRPSQCIVGCTTCANLCRGEAISFPPLMELRAFYRDHKIWNAVKQALKEEGILPTSSRTERNDDES
jgi:NAD-dependent dihydropyrimidine dehydrogenase PreA subunit